MNNLYCQICTNKVEPYIKNNEYIYYRCLSCFTSQILPQPAIKELEEFYNMYHLSEQDGGKYDWIEERMRSDFLAKINLLKKFSKKGDSLLDVGCGKGYFIFEGAIEGFKTKGIDISDSAIDFAKNKLNVDAVTGSIEGFSSLPEFNSQFNIVTLLATIEHLPDPFIVLNSIYKFLKPNGILLLDTGLGNDKFEKLLTGHSQWYDAPQHLFVFSETGLRILLEKSGFNVIKVDRNFDRTNFRKIIRWLRHSAISIGSFIFLKPLLGRQGFKEMKRESKWPMGKLILIIAQKK